MKCSECEQRLIDHLYGDCDERDAAAVREHLASCPECDARRLDLARTTRDLDAWEPVESPCDARLVTGIAAARVPAAQSSRLRRAAPWLGGIAAGAILFAALSLLGARVEKAEGRFALSFGSAPVEARSDLRELLRAEIARDRRITLDAVEGYLHDWDADQRARLVAIAEAFDAARALDEERFARTLHRVAFDAAAETRRTQTVVDDLIYTLALERTALPGAGLEPNIIP